jgi:hypothetical protein
VDAESRRYFFFCPIKGFPMSVDVNTAPIHEALRHTRLCLRNATKAGDELACAHLKALLWALETEHSTGIFPKAELDARINTLIY